MNHRSPFNPSMNRGTTTFPAPHPLTTAWHRRPPWPWPCQRCAGEVVVRLGGSRVYRHPASTDESSESVQLVWERRPELETTRAKLKGTNDGNASMNEAAHVGARPPPPTPSASPSDGATRPRAAQVAAFVYSLLHRAPGAVGWFVAVLALFVSVLALLLLTLLVLRVRLELGLGSESEAEARWPLSEPTFDPTNDQYWIQRSSELL